MGTERKKKKWPKVVLIILLIIVVIIAVVAVGGYFFIRNMFSGTPTVNITASSNAEVEITSGTISGGIDEGIYTYLGVPYAEAHEWFVPAEEVEPWDGVKECTEYGAMSPQSSMFGTDGQDNNCQNLNIWTPALNDGGKRPVMVWLHGGGFATGTANQADTNGRNLAEKEDVVVVTVNHRLGMAGYFDLSSYGEKYRYSGNVGMMDVVDALEWIQENIEVFGGDPENVTIFGQSGGGAKVMTLMTSPYAEGLFHKGIIQSGATATVGPVLAPYERSQRITELVLEDLNITADNIEELQTMDFAELDAAGSAALQQVAEEFQVPGPFGGYGTEWLPVVEGDFLPTHPVTEEGFAEAGYDIPILIGSNLNEWSMMTGGMNADINMSEEDVLASLTENYGDNAQAILDAFKSAYPNEAPVNALYTDTLLRMPLLLTMAHKADQGGAPVYSYMFTYNDPQCFHGAEIIYAFNNVTAEDTATLKMEDVMSSVWANFARTGNPGIEELPEWAPYTREEGATMILDEASMLVYNHDLTYIELVEPGFTY